MNKTLSHRARGLSSLLDTIEVELFKPSGTVLGGIDNPVLHVPAPLESAPILSTSASGPRLAPLNFSFGTLHSDLGSSHLLDEGTEIPHSATEFSMNSLWTSTSPNTLRRFTFPDLTTTSESLSPAPTAFNKAPRRSLDSRPYPSEINIDDSVGYSDVSAAMALTLLHHTLTPPTPTVVPAVVPPTAVPPTKLPSFKIQFCDVPPAVDLTNLSKAQVLPASGSGSGSGFQAGSAKEANFLDDGVGKPTISTIKQSPRSTPRNRSQSRNHIQDRYRSSPHLPPNFYLDATPPTKMVPPARLHAPTSSFPGYSYPMPPLEYSSYQPPSAVPVAPRRNPSPSSAYLPPPPNQIWNYDSVPSHPMDYSPPPRIRAPHLFQHEHHHYYHHEVPISPDVSSFLSPRSLRSNLGPYEYGYKGTVESRNSMTVPHVEQQEIKRARNPSERRDSIGAGIIKEERSLDDRGDPYLLNEREHKRVKYDNGLLR